MAEKWQSRNRNSRPPRSENFSVPLWERNFYVLVCKIPLAKVCAAKDTILAYENIAQWDDSGALEALESAKSRYWAEFNNLPSDIPLPNQDMYIDVEIDHTPFIDPKLVADLYRRPPPPPANAKEVETFNLENIQITPTGWGDEEEENTAEVKPRNLWNENGGRSDEIVQDRTTDCNSKRPSPPPANAKEVETFNLENIQITPTGWGDEEEENAANVNSRNLWNGNGGRSDEIVQDWTTDCNGNNTWDQHWNNWDRKLPRNNGYRRNGYGSSASKSRHRANSYQIHNTYEMKKHAGQWKPKHACGEPVNSQLKMHGVGINP